MLPRFLVLFLALVAGFSPAFLGCDTGPNAPDIEWEQIPVPVNALFSLGITATENGDVYLIFVERLEGTSNTVLNAYRLDGTTLTRVLPPPELSRLDIAYASGGPGSNWVARGGIGLRPGAHQTSDAFAFLSHDGGPLTPTGMGPTFSSLDGLAWNGQRVLLLVAGRGEMFRSGDAGASWELFNPGTAGRAPAGPVWFADEQTAFVNVATEYFNAFSSWRLLRSTDAGLTWKLSLPDTGWYYTVQGKQRLVAFSRASLFISADKGATWTPVPLPSGGGEVAAAAATPAGGLLLVLQHSNADETVRTNTVHYLPGIGRSWSRADIGLPLSGSAPHRTRIELPSDSAEDEALVRGAAGHYYLLLHQPTSPASARAAIFRTVEPIP